MNFDLTVDELNELAKKSNKTVEEVANDYKYALKDLEYSIKKIDSIIEEHNYKRLPDDIDILGYGINGELKIATGIVKPPKELLHLSYIYTT